MPGHAVATGSSVGGLLEGFLSGATTGLEIRGRRNDRLRLAERDLAEAARDRHVLFLFPRRAS